MSVIGVYSVKNTVTGAAYVGSSADIERRLATHKSQLLSGRHPSKKLQEAWNEYGEGCFEFSQIRLCEVEFLELFEQYFINKLEAATKGYNTALRPTARRVKSPGISEPTERALNLVAEGWTAYAAAKKEGLALSTIYRALKREKEKQK
jgi:group I intron endonuclease